MVYNIDFSIAGLLFFATYYFFVRIKYSKESKANMQFRYLIVTTFFASLLDMLTAITISYYYMVPLWFNYALNTAFFTMGAISVYMLPRYVRFIIYPDGKTYTLGDKVNVIVLIAYIVGIFTTKFTHVFFYFDENGIYTYGSLHWTTFVIPVYLCIYTMSRMFINRKIFSKLQLISVVLFVFVSLVGSMIQMIFLPKYLITYFFESLGGFIVLFGIETPDFVKLNNTMKELEYNKKLLEEAKKDEEDKNRVIHELTRSASWSIFMDENRTPVGGYWSEEFFWMLGYEKSKMGDHMITLWQESLHPDDEEFVRNAFRNGMQGIDTYDVIYRLRNINGEYRWYRGTGELKEDPQTGRCTYRGIIQDINDEKLKDDLNNEKIAALTELEKSQNALKEALEKAKSADRAKSDFLANMSHEIRTPINAVLGMNELISRESTEENIINYSADVASAGQSLLAIINDILDFSKIEAGKMEIAPADFELSSLIHDLDNLIRTKSEEKNLEFKISVDPDIWEELYADEVRIRQILVNLLSNAVKYTDTGSVSFSVRHKTIDEQNTTLEFTIDDTGIGVKEENKAELFQSFKRVDLEHNRKIQGTGLGLSIAKSFIDLMGGDISFESEYQKGTTFVVHIPVKVRSDKKIGVLNGYNATKKAKYEPSFKAPTAKILVVDDVATNLTVIKGLLKKTLVPLETATSGMECIEKARNTKYDIIFLDHMMPQMDGVETIRNMATDDKNINKETPIIMLTANAIIGARDEYLQEGFTDYLSKPVKPEALEEMIIRYLPADLLNRV